MASDALIQLLAAKTAARLAKASAKAAAQALKAATLKGGGK
ncbi:hypothetical protein OG689_44270 [Kitasatospora sp. NBC_00240]|nr:hypothetical protein [Kitasatospora sp. NBC_00240]MCX5216154.1 hypothetical protein [Kitasatospora sp. NBC_00240]